MKIQKYKVFIWEHSSLYKSHIPSTYNCSKECWKLIVKEIVLTEIETKNLIDSSNYDVCKYMLIAVPTNKPKSWYICSLYKYDKEKFSYDFVNSLYKDYLKEKEGFSTYSELIDYNVSNLSIYSKSTPTIKQQKKAYDPFYTAQSKPNYYEESFEPKQNNFKEIDKDKLWLLDNLSCNKFPARSQKIKGLGTATSELNMVTSWEAIEKGFAASFNDDFSIEHKHSYYGNCRKTQSEIVKEMIGKFCRPCPQNPNHGGGVDSVFIKDQEDAIELLKKLEDSGEIPEMILMNKISCEFSGVINPDRVTFGPSNNGATAGINAVEIAINITKEEGTEFKNRFWNNESWPFAEVLYEKEFDKPILVQLRSGPPIFDYENGEQVTKKVVVSEVYIVDGDMDLVHWEKESKILREKVVEMNIGNEGIEKTIAVWHSGGALCSHFGVHCREYKPTMPYVTSDKSPKIGDVIEMGVKGKEDLDSLRLGLIEGLEKAKIDLDSNDGRRLVKQDLKNFLASLHICSIADLSDETTSKFIGYSWGIGARIISALPLGEARHNEKMKKSLNEILMDPELIKEEKENEEKVKKEKMEIYEKEMKEYNEYMKKGITYNEEKAKKHESYFVQLLIQEKKVDAVKLYKAMNNCSFMYAKQVIDTIEYDIELNIPYKAKPQLNYSESYDSNNYGISDSIKIIVDSRDKVYKNAWKLPISLLIEGLSECSRGFLEEKWNICYGGKKWHDCTNGLIGVFNDFRNFIKEPSEENKLKIVENINLMINLAHNGGGFSWLDKIIMKDEFDSASLLPHFMLSPRRSFEAKEIKKVGIFSMNLRALNLVKKLDKAQTILEGLEEKKIELETKKILLEKEKADLDKKMAIENEKKKIELDKIKKEAFEKIGLIEIELEQSLLLEKTQLHLSEQKGNFGLTGQFYISGMNNIHIQVKFNEKPLIDKFNGSYGFSYDLVLGIEYKSLMKVISSKVKEFSINMKLLQSFATFGKFKYTPLTIWKNLVQGIITLNIEGIYMQVYDLELWEIIKKAEDLFLKN